MFQASVRSLLKLTILREIGTDVSRFRNASAFASWLGLCPEKISGGKMLVYQKPTCSKPRSDGLRMWAQSLHDAKDYLGEFFRRITRKLGRPQAITATAHKLAQIIFHLLTTKEAYNESVFHKTEEETIRRAQYRLRRQAPNLVFKSSPRRTGDVSLRAGLSLATVGYGNGV
jgi:hypothetical protein